MSTLTLESPAIPPTDDSQLNWPRIRNAIRKRLRAHFRIAGLNWSDFDDAVQDACGFAHTSIIRGVCPGLAIFRSVGRVKRGQTLTYAPAARDAWEERPDVTRSLNGVGAATRRAARGLPLSGSTPLQ